MRLRDSFGRTIIDLRISVTDRCNYKCVYCRTGNEGAQYTELPIADYLRITVGTDGQIDRLLSALSEILGSKPAAA